MQNNRELIFQKIKNLVGDKHLITDEEKMYNYSFCIVSEKVAYPMGVILPGTAAEVAAVLKYCSDNEIEVVVRGGGTNVSKGIVSSGKGFILSLERLNTIMQVNKTDRTIVVEAGVITERIAEEALQHNLRYPQNISSASQCYIGGNIALSSGSPNSLKYGSIRNTVLNLEVALPDGRLMWTGKNVSKNATGYNLTQLFIGSEGTLGIITKAVIKLETPVETALLLISFTSVHKLFQFVDAFFNAGYNALCMEFLDKNGYRLVSAFLKKNQLEADAEGLLWIEYELNSKPTMEALCGLISEYTDREVLFAEQAADKKNLWEYRKRIGEAAINYSKFKDIDIVVPRSASFKMYEKIDSICKQLNFHFIVVGHIGDGNFHVNIFNNGSVSWEKDIQLFLAQVFGALNEFGGTLSGEHGVGSLYNDYLNIVVPEHQLSLMRQLKQVFDPKNILNPRILFN